MVLWPAGAACRVLDAEEGHNAGHVFLIVAEVFAAHRGFGLNDVFVTEKLSARSANKFGHLGVVDRDRHEFGVRELGFAAQSSRRH